MAARAAWTRGLALGFAAGMRGSWGVAGPVLAGGPVDGRVRAAALLGVAVETVADKHPSVPSRLGPLGLPPRLLSGSLGAAVLARRAGGSPLVPVVLGVVGAVAGAAAGQRWRSWAADRMPDWQAAVAEDAVTAVLATAACREHGAG